MIGRGGFLRSFDGGRHWRQTGAVRGRLLSFADQWGGWSADGAVCRRTMDGGATWSRLTSAPKSGVTSLTAAGGAVWAAAGSVIRSADGGRHWALAGGRWQATAVTAADARRAWTAGPGGVIRSTRDRGLRWTVQRTGTRVHLLDVVFFDRRHGWAAGAGGTVLRTADGGAHWRRAATGTRRAIAALDFGDARHGLALLAPARGRAAVLWTASGGRTWSRCLLPAEARLPTALACSAPLKAVLVARAADSTSWCWQTSDGGLTWRRAGALPGRDVWRAAAVSGTTVAAVAGSGAVALSADGGETWTDAGRPAGPVPLAAAVFPRPGFLMVAGPTGALLTRSTADPA